MGFELSAIVSSPVSPQQKLALTLAARRRWPFLRLPLRDTHPERLVLGGIERTSYMLGDEESGTLAMILDDLLGAELAELSREFPTVALAWVYTNCFGGHCEDDGRVCRDGEVMAEGSSLRSLLAAVELESEG
ncbi:MAG: hypothetical protein KC431_11895 [Myxococcales bacterium]|nr:hypothetical protein [Myxococcales bacterium]